jgi:pentatricopeptide repeat protein
VKNLLECIIFKAHLLSRCWSLMRLIAKCLRPNGPIIARHSSRLPSHSLPTAGIRRRCRPNVNPVVARFLVTAWKRTREPAWSFVGKLNMSRTDASLARALRRENISWDEYLGWRRAVGLHVDPVSKRSRKITPPSETLQLPTWALIHLLTYRVRTPLQAFSICQAALSQIYTTDSRLVPSLLTLSVHILADHQVLGSLRPMVFTFLQIPQQISYLQYQSLLEAISRFHPSSETTQLIVAVLEQMLTNGLIINLSTYRNLLHSHALTATLARRLQKLMFVQDVIPTSGILHAFFLIFARRQATRLAFKYFTSSSSGTSSTSPSLSKSVMRLRQLSEVSGKNFPSSLTLLSSFRNPSAAFRHISSNLKSKDPKFASLDVRGWTSILSLTARGNGVTSSDLLNLFSQIKENFRPTAVTFTVLIRGLLSRQDYDNAKMIWNELLESGIPLDVKSLSVGVEMFTLAGMPLQAFRLLEEYAVKGPLTSSRGGLLKPSHPRVTLSPAFINVFMENLLRINRPDMVFVMWDHSEILYRVMPDSSTLNILLSTARIVGKYDDTLSGFLAQFRAQVASTLHSDTLSFNVMSRDEVVRMIESTLASDNRKKRRRKPTGLWGNTPAWQKAARIFCHAVLGNFPTLLQVSAPAIALRSSADDMARHPLKELARSIMGPPPQEDAFQDMHADINEPISLVRLGLYPLGAYPKIFPTKITFHNYIFLLGLNDQAAQIPLVMAWMRELGILPMTKTVAMALVFWAEVSLRAPLLEQWMGEGEYAKFTRWIENWIGMKNMPGMTRMSKTSKIIARARDGRDFLYAKRV